MFEQFAEALISWNLEDGQGQVLPCTLESVRNYPDYEFMATLANTWVEAVTGVKDELGKGSPSGDTFPEGSIPMETLSPSLAS